MCTYASSSRFWGGSDRIDTLDLAWIRARGHRNQTFLGVSNMDELDGDVPLAELLPCGGALVGIDRPLEPGTDY